MDDAREALTAADVVEPAALPDFDAYPIRHRLASAAVAEGGVSVRWDDGLAARYHPLWLRENAPDPATTHPVTREQALQLVDIAADLAAMSASVDGAGGLVVGWSSGETSRYHPGWLRAHTHAGGRDGADDGRGLPPRATWDGAFADRLPRFDGMAVLDDDAAVDAWAEALHVHGVSILTGLPAAPETIERVAARLGPVRTTNFGGIFEVRSRPDADSNAYTAMALPLHTDLSTREYVPGLQFLFCLENGAEGGDSLLADGFHIADRLRAEDPTAFAALTTIPVTFANKARGTDFRWSTPMLRLGPDGAIDEVRWSPWLRAPLDASYDDTDRLYRALRRAFTLAEEDRQRLRVRLRPGDLLAFDNRRVLHGRTGFDPSTGSRWLRGCYLEREDLHSRLRIAGRRRRAMTT